MDVTPGNASQANVTRPVVLDDVVTTLSEQFVVNVDDTRRLLGKLSERQVYRLMDAGELETIYIGKRRMVLIESIRAYVERQRDAA